MTKLCQKIVYEYGKYVEIVEFSKPFIYENNARDTSNFCTKEKKARERTEFSLRRAKENVRRVIAGNEEKNMLFLTLTFRDNILDVQTANAHFSNFLKRLRREFGKEFKYVAILEFQKRGAVHYHAVFAGLPVSRYRERKYRIIAKIWGHGFVDAVEIRNVKRISWYVVKYMTKGILDPRLIGEKVYFTSRNIVRPQKYRDAEAVDNFEVMSARMECINQVQGTTTSGVLIIRKEYAWKN